MTANHLAKSSEDRKEKPGVVMESFTASTYGNGNKYGKCSQWDPPKSLLAVVK